MRRKKGNKDKRFINRKRKEANGRLCIFAKTTTTTTTTTRKPSSAKVIRFEWKRSAPKF